jgi:hypothetical protein
LLPQPEDFVVLGGEADLGTEVGERADWLGEAFLHLAGLVLDPRDLVVARVWLLACVAEFVEPPLEFGG